MLCQCLKYLLHVLSRLVRNLEVAVKALRGRHHLCLIALDLATICAVKLRSNEVDQELLVLVAFVLLHFGKPLVPQIIEGLLVC